MPERISPYCHHFHRAMAVYGQKWTPEVVRALLGGRARFNEIAAAIPGLSDRVLSQRLKALEGDGLVTRTVTPDRPVRVAYRLTPKGRGLGRAVGALAAWAEEWITQEEAEGAPAP